MAGKFSPVTENPVPEIESALMVTAVEPLEVNVTDWVTALPTETLPNDSEVALTLNAGVAALNCMAKLFEVEFVLADNVAVCALITDEIFAVNEAEDAPEATVTLTGTSTVLLLLASVTTVPLLGAAELIVTVHVVDPAPVNELFPQESALNVDATPVPVPLRLTATTGALLESVNFPAVEFAVVGEN